MKKVLLALMFCLFAGCGAQHTKIMNSAKDYCMQICGGRAYNVVCFEYEKPDQPICMCAQKSGIILHKN